MRSSHRRKSSISTPLNLQGRYSPLPYPDQKSPQGRKSPILLVHQPTMRSPGFSTYLERRSPTNNVQGRKSPVGFYQGFEPDINRSPTHYDMDKRSPSGLGPNDNGRRSPTVQVSQGRRSPIYYEERRMSTVQVQGSRSPIGYSQGLITSITVSPMDNRCSIIPPITVSNPSETCRLTPKSEFNNDNPRDSELKELSLKDISPVTDTPQPPPLLSETKKEKPSVMREILAFVRKPSKKVSSTAPTSSASSSRTGRFAAAFSRADSGSCTPLLRQSTFSTSPAASSRAAKSAVTKQMSEVGYEPKISLKFTKMSLRLRKSGGSDQEKKYKDKKSSGDEISESENESSQSRSDFKVSGSGLSSRSASIVPFELENVHFEKVGESYIKHDSIITEESIDSTSPIKIAATTEECIALSISQNNLNSYQNSSTQPETASFKIDSSSELVELKKSLEHIINSSLGNESSITTNIDKDFNTLKSNDNKKIYDTITIDSQTIKMTVQCPTFEIEPPSRRASFDPPRSPYLESLRSPASTTNNTDHSSRFASGDDSFELIDTDRNRESSFEDRYSSRDTSFDISRYQSTSYEDQNSSFELVESDMQHHKSGSGDSDKNQSHKVDLRKSSIELVDVETFQRQGPEGRKSSLETHFDYTKPPHYKKSELTSSRSAFGLPRTKKQISEPSRSRDPCSSNMKTHYSAPHRARSPLSTQTSSNFSSRDSYDSSFEPISLPRLDSMSPFTESTKQHFPYLRKSSNDNQGFLCTDQRCAAIFEPRPSRMVSPFLSDSGNEFEPPSPRRAASASPKHTFTFRIVMKKVDSSPDAICPSAERRGRIAKRRDSRKKKLMDAGKSF